MPDALSDVIRSRTGTCLGSITTNYVVPSIVLQIPDASGEEAGSNQVEDASGDDQEDLEGGLVSSSADHQHGGLFEKDS